MNRSHIIVAGCVLVACGLGLLVGFRLGRRPPPNLNLEAVSGSTGATEMTGCVDFRQAGDHTGQTGCISGRVLRVYTSRAGNTYLDFCPDYRNCPFSSVIFSSEREKFGDVGSLSGKVVEIRGSISVYQGRPQIIIREPEQICLAP